MIDGNARVIYQKR